MDQQRPLLYFALLFLSYLIWTAWMQDHAPKPVIAKTSTTAITQSIPNASPSNTNSANRSDIPEGVATAAATTQAVPTDKTPKSTATEIHVKTDVLDIIISTEGGSLIQADLLTYPISLEEKDNPVRVLDRNKSYAAQSGLISESAELAPNHYAQFTTPQTEYQLLDGSDELIVPLSWTNGKGITVTKRYIFKKGSFLVSVEQTVDNQSGVAWKGSPYQQITHGQNNISNK
jgi:YidC/Oxa1 family membrane protein insertase